MWNLQNFPKDAWVCRAPPYCAFIQRDAFEEVYEHWVLINSGPGNGVFPHVAPPTRLHLQFPRETGLILRCAGKIGNTFQTKQENRHSCCNQEGRRGSNDVVWGTWVFPSSEACMLGNFGGAIMGAKYCFALQWERGQLLRRCGGQGAHAAKTMEPRGFSRVVAGFSSYDGDFRLPLVLALGSPNFPSSCERKLGVVLESLQGQRDLI